MFTNPRHWGCWTTRSYTYKYHEPATQAGRPTTHRDLTEAQANSVIMSTIEKRSAVLITGANGHEVQKFRDDIKVGRDLSEVPNQEAEELLRKHYGHGWTSLEESVKANVATLA